MEIDRTSPFYKLGQCGATLEIIMGHLGAARMQRAASDDKIIADHIDAALEIATKTFRAISAADGAKP